MLLFLGDLPRVQLNVNLIYVVNPLFIRSIFLPGKIAVDNKANFFVFSDSVNIITEFKQQDSIQ